MAEFDQAQSPRLGQRVAPEQPGLQILSLNTLPEVAPRGMVVYLADKDTVAVYNGSAWMLAGDAKTQTFIGTAEPVADDEGDLWFNTSNSSLYVWMDDAWVRVVDPAVELLEDTVAQNQLDAMEAIGELSGQLDGKVTTFYDTVQPTEASEGDLWINETTNRLFRYDGTIWVEIQDEDIAAAIAAAGDAQSTADGKIESYYQDDAPTGLDQEDEGDLWIDTNDNKKLHRWSGSAWVDVADSRIAATSALLADINDNQIPAIEGQLDQKVTTWFQSAFPWANGDTTHDVDEGDLFWDSDDKKVWRWGGAGNRNWVSVTDPDIVTALSNAGAAVDTAGDALEAANTKINHYAQTTQPWANGDLTHDLDAGDIWTNTSSSGDNLRYYWAVPSRVWTALPVGNAAVTGDAMDNKTIIGPTLVMGDNQYSGERIIVRKDGAGGIIEFFTGIAGEAAPGTLNPFVYSDKPSVMLSAGSAGANTDQANLVLVSSTPGFSSSYLYSDYIYLQGNVSISGQLSADETSLTMTSGSVGTGTFRDSVDARVSSGITTHASSSHLSQAQVDARVVAVNNAGFGGGLIINSGGMTVGGTVQLNSLTGTDNACAVQVGNSGVLSRGPQMSTLVNSSKRFKKSIKPLKVDPAKVLALEPVSFTWKKDEPYRPKNDMGFIVEQAKELGLDHWVGDNDEGVPTRFDYRQFCVAQQVVLRDQQKQIDELRAMVQALTT